MPAVVNRAIGEMEGKLAEAAAAGVEAELESANVQLVSGSSGHGVALSATQGKVTELERQLREGRTGVGSCSLFKYSKCGNSGGANLDMANVGCCDLANTYV